ncbi:hypothetical protein FGB62_27g21 [Gracilaria domingensis]|nr:hypothetical protein FGB62_27g21 [Gracilaria domingensis]
MVPFLAQYGRKWLQDSKRARSMVKRDHISNCSGFSMKHFVRYAAMLIWESSCESGEECTAFNWSKTWSSVLIHKAFGYFEGHIGYRMPFGSKGDESSFVVPTFPVFHSKIKRLVDSLLDELFERRSSGQMEIIQQICGEDLDNFMIFLNSDIVNPAKEPDALLGSHSSTTAGATLSSNDLHRGNVNNDIHETEGIIEAHGGSGREARSSEDIIDDDRVKTTGISDEVRGELQSLLAHSVKKTERNCATNRCMDVWSLGRVVNEKFSETNDKIGEFLCRERRFNPDMSYPSEKRVVEFTIHLENVFTTYSGTKHPGIRETPENHDRNRYYQDLCGKATGCRRLLATEDVKPLCTFELQFWKLWDLPRCIPPALGDLDVQECTEGTTRGLKFVGYIMGIVRDGLAKWTNENFAQNLDTEVWSPRVVIRSAQVEFDASDELRMQLKQYMCGVVRLDASFFETIGVRVLWECQKHLVEAIHENVYGPSDIQLMLLCVLGFPALRVSSSEEDLKNSEDTGTTICGAKTSSTIDAGMVFFCTFMPDRSGEHSSAAIWFRLCESTLKIRVKLIPVHESGKIQHGKHSITFSWAEWIHSFEACMKVLSYDYGDGELREVGADEESLRHDIGDGEPSSNEEIVARCEVGAERKTDAVDRNDVIIGDAEDGMERAENGGNEDAAAEGDGVTAENSGMAVVEQVVECTCKRNRYRLNQRAKRVFVRGTWKYFWEWEGWKAQEAFKRDRYPILYEDGGNGNGNVNGSTNGGDVERHTMNSLGETRIPMPREDGGTAVNASGPSGAPPPRG